MELAEDTLGQFFALAAFNSTTPSHLNRMSHWPTLICTSKLHRSFLTGSPHMPTVGWILEGAWEAFLEAKERVPDPTLPRTPSFRCPFYDLVLETKRHLLDHVSTSHHVARPIMLLGHKEPMQTSVIRVATSARSFVFANASAANVKIDGKQAHVPVRELAGRLSKIKKGEVLLTLTNASQKRAMPVLTSYEISFRVADSDELKQVEVAFSERIMSAALTKASIDKFLTDPRCLGAGSDYANGLANFAMGVLLKERPASEHLTTPFARYRESYGTALRALTDFQRPFSRLISELIRFALNEFSESNRATGYWELDLANTCVITAGLPSARPFHSCITSNGRPCPPG